MTVAGKLGRNIGLGTDYLAEATVAGPASYAAGGFTVDTLLTAITRVIVVPRDSRIGALDDFVRSAVYSIAGGVVTIVVSEQQISATNTWAEIADTTDISAQTWDVIAIGTP